MCDRNRFPKGLSDISVLIEGHWFAAVAHRYTASLFVPDSGEKRMLQRLLFGLITVTSLTLVGCAHSPQ